MNLSQNKIRQDVYFYEAFFGKLPVIILMPLIPVVMAAQTSYARVVVSYFNESPYLWAVFFAAVLLLVGVPLYLKSRTIKFSVVNGFAVWEAGAVLQAKLPIPISRIRYIRKDQTLISRAFNLHYMKIYTEGSDGMDMKVGPLLIEDIDAYSQELLKDKVAS